MVGAGKTQRGDRPWNREEGEGRGVAGKGERREREEEGKQQGRREEEGGERGETVQEGREEEGVGTWSLQPRKPESPGGITPTPPPKCSQGPKQDRERTGRPRTPGHCP